MRRSLTQLFAAWVFVLAGISDAAYASHGHGGAPSEVPDPSFTTNATLTSEINLSREGHVRVFPVADDEGNASTVRDVGLANRNAIYLETDSVCLSVRARVYAQHAFLFLAPEAVGLKGFVAVPLSCLADMLPDEVSFGAYHNSAHNQDSGRFSGHGTDTTGFHLRWRLPTEVRDSLVAYVTHHTANSSQGTTFVTSRISRVARGRLEHIRATLGMEGVFVRGRYKLSTESELRFSVHRLGAARVHAAFGRWVNTHFSFGGFVERRQNFIKREVAGSGEWLFGLRSEISF